MTVAVITADDTAGEWGDISSANANFTTCRAGNDLTLHSTADLQCWYRRITSTNHQIIESFLRFDTNLGTAAGPAVVSIATLDLFVTVIDLGTGAQFVNIELYEDVWRAGSPLVAADWVPGATVNAVAANILAQLATTAMGPAPDWETWASSVNFIAAINVTGTTQFLFIDEDTQENTPRINSGNQWGITYDTPDDAGTEPFLTLTFTGGGFADGSGSGAGSPQRALPFLTKHFSHQGRIK